MRGARGAVFRDAGGERTARGAHGARGVCGAVFRDTGLCLSVAHRHRALNRRSAERDKYSTGWGIQAKTASSMVSACG